MDEEAQVKDGAPDSAINGPNDGTNATTATASSSKRKTEHLGSTRQYWRDIILGVNDGLISTFLLVAGVAGGGLSSQNILLTAIAGAIAGAVSMFSGEYVATKSQNEVMHGELALEKAHVAEYLEEEINELDTHLALIGLEEADERLRTELRDYYRSKPDELLKVMTVLEFGVLAAEERTPLRAGLTSCGLFASGALPSVLPFIFSGDKPESGLIAAAVLTFTALMLVGAVKTWATRVGCVSSSIENLIIAGCGGGLAYGVGYMFDHVVKKG